MCINSIIFLCHESLPLQYNIQTERTDPAKVYQLLPGCLQELGLQKNLPYSNKGAAIGFQNLTIWKFRKTQRDMTSELEEHSSYCRI